LYQLVLNLENRSLTLLKYELAFFFKKKFQKLFIIKITIYHYKLLSILPKNNLKPTLTFLLFCVYLIIAKIGRSLGMENPGLIECGFSPHSA